MGICERLFALAKESLDLRDNPMQPSVLLNACDIMFACKQLPPPPGIVGGPAVENGDAAAGGSAEFHCLKDQLQRLQAENVHLHTEIERLQRETAQGSAADVLNATMIPNSTLQGTTAVELRGIQELLKEVRRLRSEVQWRDARLEEKEREALELSERLRQAESAGYAGRFLPGTPVQYFSGSLNRWIDAVVESFNVGKYDLDVKKGVVPDRVRRRGSEGGS